MATRASVLSSDGTYQSLGSPIDIATTVAFTSDPIVSGVTIPAALHVTELRTAINSVRVAAGLGAASWTATPAAGSGQKIAASQIMEMRTRLDEACSLLASVDHNLGPPLYTDPALAGGVRVRGAHIQELRERTR